MAQRFKPAKTVRIIERGETIVEIVDELKLRAWLETVEHMALQLEGRVRLMVKGGRDGIIFSVEGKDAARTLHMRYERRSVRVTRIYGHTHPIATGPSDGDLEALIILGQKHSYIFEPGGDYRGTCIRPKAASKV